MPILLDQAENKGKAVLVGDKGYFEIPAYWKGNKAYLHKDGMVTEIVVDMESDFGGEVIACGTPKEVSKNPNSYTGQYLKQFFNV